MFNKKSLRLALSGSVLFILLGSLSACSEDPAAPKTAPQHTETTGTCTIVSGVLICSN